MAAIEKVFGHGIFRIVHDSAYSIAYMCGVAQEPCQDAGEYCRIRGQLLCSIINGDFMGMIRRLLVIVVAFAAAKVFDQSLFYQPSLSAQVALAVVGISVFILLLKSGFLRREELAGGKSADRYASDITNQNNAAGHYTGDSRAAAKAKRIANLIKRKQSRTKRQQITFKYMFVIAITALCVLLVYVLFTIIVHESPEKHLTLNGQILRVNRTMDKHGEDSYVTIKVAGDDVRKLKFHNADLRSVLRPGDGVTMTYNQRDLGSMLVRFVNSTTNHVIALDYDKIQSFVKSYLT